MEALDRRTMLRTALCGAAAATVALALAPDELEAMPLGLEKDLAGKTGEFVERAQVVVGPG